MWNAKSHDAYQGNSHLSGIEMTSSLKRCVHDALRPSQRDSGGGGCSGSPVSQSSTE